MKRFIYLLAAFFIFAGLAIRFGALSFVSLDMKDFLIPWYDQLAAHGFAALREPFSNYTPPYLYFLALVTTTQAFLPKVVAIKLISIFFDLCDAWIVYRIVKLKYPQPEVGMLGAGIFLVLPTIFLNSAFWGQADSIYACFVLACVYFLMTDKPLAAILFWGIALAFKAQTVFLGPLLLLLTIRKRIPWFYFTTVPAVYILLMIPAWIAGRPFADLITIYLNQADVYHALSMHGPTLYVFISNDFYDPALVVGSAITLIVVCAWIWICARNIKEFAPEIILICALVSVAILPFFLPKMHDRYFYLADILSFLVAFYFPRFWFLALGYQLVSGMAYSIFLIPSVISIRRRVADAILNWSAIINTAVMGLVFWSQWRIVKKVDS